MPREVNLWRAFEQPEDSESTRRTLRITFERLLFTQRGRFALLISVLIANFDTTQATLYASSTTTTSASLKSDLAVSVITPEMVESFFQLLGGGVLILLVFLLGLFGLLIIDGYEHRIGTVIDTDD